MTFQLYGGPLDGHPFEWAAKSIPKRLAYHFSGKVTGVFWALYSFDPATRSYFFDFTSDDPDGVPLREDVVAHPFRKVVGDGGRVETWRVWTTVSDIQNGLGGEQ